MASFMSQMFIKYKEIVLDEIALEGLEGVSVNRLWQYIEKRFSTKLTAKFKDRIWSFVLSCGDIALYEIPVPRKHMELRDRFSEIDEQSGHLGDPTVTFDYPFIYTPTPEFGSCEHYATRKLVEKNLSLAEATEKYGDCLVLVASATVRWNALAPHIPKSWAESLTPLTYCMLELVGRGRENGQMTVGNTNLTRMITNPKFLFYTRKNLHSLGLVKQAVCVQIVRGKGVRSSMLTLNRFYPSKLCRVPHRGRVHDTCEYLRRRPGLSEAVDSLVRRGMVTRKEVKKLRLKKHCLFSVFDREAQPGEPPTKRRRKDDKIAYLKFNVESDDAESSDEEEENQTKLPNEYKVGVDLQRQSYEQLLRAGTKGLTQVELRQLLGLEYYAGRAVCRGFVKRGLVREFMEDSGKQRTARYVALAARAEGATEHFTLRQRLLGYIRECRAPGRPRGNVQVRMRRASAAQEEEDEEAAPVVTDVAVLPGLEHVRGFAHLLQTKKPPTLRHLRYAVAAVALVHAEQCVCGFQSLSTQIARRVGEQPMDTKPMRTLVQKLLCDNVVRLYTFQWPGRPNQTHIICAPHVGHDHDILSSKYNEIAIRALSVAAKSADARKADETQRPLATYCYPRYLKIRKLHEFIARCVWFRAGGVEGHPWGFASPITLIPDMSVELALGLISPSGVQQLKNMYIEESMLGTKLRDAPKEVFKVLLQCKSFKQGVLSSVAALASFGLLQRSARVSDTGKHSGYLKDSFYVNRNARLTDTRGVWPRAGAADVTAFHFATIDDVERYWNTLHLFATGTECVRRRRGRAVAVPVPARAPGEAAAHDDGHVYGDGRGPAGLDSTYHIEIKRLWEQSFSKQLHYKQFLVKPGAKKKEPKLPQPRRVAKKRAPKTKAVIVKKSLAAVRRARRSQPALRWSRAEDRVLMLCRAAAVVFGPQPQPGSLTVRNLAAKDILTLYDKHKTGAPCHKRTVYLDASNATLCHERECLLNEARRRRHLIAKYEGLQKKLRLNWINNMSRYISSARLPFLELVWILLQIADSARYTQRLPAAAVSLEDFHKNYTLTSTVDKPYNLYKDASDVEVTTLKEAIIMALVNKGTNEVDEKTSLRIYEFLKTCKENSIRNALVHLRKAGAIAARVKGNTKVVVFSLHEALQSQSTYNYTINSYKISKMYRRRMTCKLSSFANEIATSLSEGFPRTLQAASARDVCVLSELGGRDLVDLATERSPAVAVVSRGVSREEDWARGRVKAGALSCKLKDDAGKLNEVYKVEPYDEVFESITSCYVDREINTNYDKDDTLIKILLEKKENGATFDELQEATSTSSPTLVAKLQQLESSNIIKRVGFHESVLVLKEYVASWSLPHEGARLTPAPWLTLSLTIKRDVFMQWASVVMNKVCDFPGSNLTQISNDCDFLSARSAGDLCIFLMRCKCLNIKTLTVVAPDLFSDDLEPQLGEYNPYAQPTNLLVFPVVNSLSLFAVLRKSVLESDKADV